MVEECDCANLLTALLLKETFTIVSRGLFLAH